MMWYLASLCVLSLLCIFAHGAPVADSSPADDSAALAGKYFTSLLSDVRGSMHIYRSN